MPVLTQEFQASSTVPFLAFGMSLNLAAITALFLETAASVNGISVQPGMKVCNATPDLLDSVARIFVQKVETKSAKTQCFQGQNNCKQGKHSVHGRKEDLFR